MCSYFDMISVSDNLMDEISTDGDITRRSTNKLNFTLLTHFKAVPPENLRAKAQIRAT